MRRRSFLAAATGATLGGVGLGTGPSTASAHTPPAGGTAPAGSSDPDGSGPLGRIELPDAAEAVVGPDDTTVYVATQDGFAAVDTAAPRAPTLLTHVEGVLAGHEGGPMANVQDVAVDGERLLVVGPAHPRQVVAAAVIFDVADPRAPERIGYHETDYPIHNAFLADGLAYLTGNGAEGNPLVVVDVVDEFAELGRWSLFDVDPAWRNVASTLRVVHDVWVRDSLAYVAHWDAGTWIVDVSDPGDPETVERVRGRDPETLAAVENGRAVARESTELPGNDHFVTVDDDGSLLGIGVEAWDHDGDGGGGPGGIELYDVSDPTEPTRRGSIDPPPTTDPTRDGVWTTAHNFELTADHCYSSWYQGGVAVHDVSDPSAPAAVSAWRDETAATFWTARRARPGETFVAASVGIGGEVGPDVTDAVEGTGTPGAGDGAPGAAPALYVFADPVADATAPTDSTGTPDGGAPGTGDSASAAGPGFGPLAALAGLGTIALGLGRRRREE